MTFTLLSVFSPVVVEDLGEDARVAVEEVLVEHGVVVAQVLGQPGTDILFLKHACSILRQSSDPVCGSWKSQSSSPCGKQHKSLTCSIMEKPHTVICCYCDTFPTGLNCSRT